MLQQVVGGDLCGPDINQDPINGFIQGYTRIATPPVIGFNILITAIAVIRIEQHTIVFLATHGGKLKKVRATIC